MDLSKCLKPAFTLAREGFLEKSSVGEGELFLSNLTKSVKFLRENAQNMKYLDGLVNELNVTWRSSFSNVAQKAKGENNYMIEMSFKGHGMELELKNDSPYKLQVKDIYNVLKTDSTNPMPNLMICLDKVEIAGYNYPMYIHLFPMAGETTLLATLYNTNQNDKAKNFYHQSEFFVLQKISN